MIIDTPSNDRVTRTRDYAQHGIGRTVYAQPLYIYSIYNSVIVALVRRIDKGI